MSPPNLPDEYDRFSGLLFIVCFIVGFRSDTQGPWYFFSNKKCFVLVRLFLLKKNEILI